MTSKILLCLWPAFVQGTARTIKKILVWLYVSVLLTENFCVFSPYFNLHA